MVFGWHALWSEPSGVPGLLHFCCGTALAMLLAGLWLRWHDRLSGKRMAVFVAVFAVLLTTHPIPIAIFLVFAGLHFLLTLLRRPHQLLGLRRELLTVCGMAVVAVAWVSRGKVDAAASSSEQPLVRSNWAANAIVELKLWPITPFGATAYRVPALILLLLVLVALGATLVRMRQGCFRPSEGALLLTSLLCFCLFTVVPVSINNSSYFPDRFPIFWLLFMIAFVAPIPLPSLAQVALAGGAVAASLIMLGLQWTYTSSLAEALRPVLETPLLEPRSRGVILAGAIVNTRAQFDPFIWAGSHYFRRSHAILLNAPWTDLPIIMLRPSSPRPWSHLSPVPETVYLSSALRQHGSIPDLDFIVGVGARDSMTVINSIAASYRFKPAAAGNEYFRFFAPGEMSSENAR